MENVTEDDAREQFLGISKALSYGTSVFFGVQTIDDQIGLFPVQIILAINEYGVHFFRPVPKEHLHSAKLRQVNKFGSSDNGFICEMRVAGALHTFRFVTKQGEEIRAALRTHINDVMSRPNFKAPSVACAESSKETKSESSEMNNQIQNELEARNKELQVAVESSKKLMSENKILEQSIFNIEKKKTEEVEILQNRYEQERKVLQLRVSELESKLVLLQNNLKELEELREMKENIDRKNEETSAILKMQGAQLAELEKLYKEEQALSKRYYNTIEDMHRELEQS